MISAGRKLFGLLDGGKRIYRFQENEGEVDREQFEYCVQLMDLVFGTHGYVDTLGPTWNMVHDPRFEAAENCFIYNRRSVFGGDPRQGTQTCLPDGTFVSGVQDLEQYAEMLGEGRYYVGVVTASGKDPHDVAGWSDADIWALIKRENPQQFSRDGKPNRNANNYFKLFKADLLGLVADYAEVAKVQEWVLLEENGTLVEEEDIAAYEESGEKHRVWLEIDLLEKALTFRAGLRVTAALILNKLGIDPLVEQVGGITDFERDHLLKIVYGGKWPEGRLEMYTNVASYLAGLQFQGTFEERQAKQAAQLSYESKEYIAALKRTEAKKAAGEELTADDIQPITRYTEPVIEVASSPEELAMEAILNNPLKQYVLVRLADIEKRKEGFDELIQPWFENKTVSQPPDIEVWQKESDRLGRAAALLLPVLEADYKLTDEKFASVMEEVEWLDPQAVITSGAPEIEASVA